MAVTELADTRIRVPVAPGQKRLDSWGKWPELYPDSVTRMAV